MKTYKFFLLGLGAAMTFGLAGCGSSGSSSPPVGQDPVDPNPAFAEVEMLDTQLLAPEFGAAVAINDESLAVGLIDGGPTPTTPKAIAWNFDAGETQLLALPVGAGDYSAAYGVNNAGAIVGEMEDEDGIITAAYWADMETVAAPLAIGESSSAYGINSEGVIVGEIFGNGASAAVYWTSSSATPVPLPLPLGATTSSAYFINVFGDIVGEVNGHASIWRLDDLTDPDSYQDPILLSDFAIGDAAHLTGDSAAWSINGDGIIVGEFEGTDGRLHAVRWIPVTGDEYTLVDLGPVDVNSGAYGINNAGRVVGFVTDALDVPEASAWGVANDEHVTMHGDLPNSKALAINIHGQAVGLTESMPFIALP